MKAGKITVKEAIDRRRAYRSLEPTRISDELIGELFAAAQLAPSCFNNQPTRFIFVRDSKILHQLQTALSRGNEWAYAASLVIVVFSREKDDCVIRERIYHLFDDGLAVAFLLLRATELGLVAHPIAGFSPQKVRDILGIPEEYQVITLIIVGKKAEEISPVLSEEQRKWETSRPLRKPFAEVAAIDRFPGG